ncbi:hypothetical protein ACWGR4_25960 [Embleya sp. NPDC055664]
MGAERALVIGIGRFDADSCPDETPVGAPTWSDLPFVAEVVPPVAAALDRLGYTIDVRMDPDSVALRSAVDGALGSARVVYVAAHGNADVSDPSRVDVVPADARVGRGTNATQWVNDAQRLGTPTLFLLDLCRSGRAATLPHLVHRAGTNVRAWVIAASTGDQDAFDGLFSRVVAEVLDDLARTGLDTDPARPYVHFSVVARHIHARMSQRSAFAQDVWSTPLDPGPVEPDLPFFPNGAYNPAAAARGGVADPALRVFLDPADARHFTDKAGTRLTGRRTHLRLLAPWLDDVTTGGLRVVTGSPGVGKSALLGALACAAHPELVAVAPQVRERLGARDTAGCPSINDRLAAVHARGRSSSEVLASVARQLRLAPDTDTDANADTPVDAGTLAALLPATGDVPAVLVDALDEAADPPALCAELVRLARATRPDGTRAARLLVGTRPWRPMFTALLDPAEAAGGLTDLDDADPVEVRDDLAAHLSARLADLPAYAPPGRRAIRESLARGAAERLAPTGGRRPEWGAFLVAGILTRHLEHRPAPETPDAAAELGRSAPITLPDVLDLDLAARPDGRTIRALLTALATARGEGMPLEVALPLAGVFAPDLTPEQARTLLPEALFYLRTTPDTDGTLLHRLFHQALVDHLAPRRPDTAHRILDHLLTTHATHADHLRAWDTAPPYLLRHAPAHAEAADRLDDVLTDTEYLTHADPAALVAAFPNAHGDDAVLASSVYRASIGTHRHTDPPTRRRLLALDATRLRAQALATAFTDKIASDGWTAVAATGGRLDPACRDTLTGHTAWVLAVACTVVNGRPIAVTGSFDHTVRTWDLTSGHPVGEPLTGHTGPVFAVACTMLDGRAVAVTGSDDDTVRIWDLTSGRPHGEPLTGRTYGVRAVACTVMDGRPVAVTGSNDNTARIWDLTSGRPHGEPLTGHTGPVTAVACSVINGKPVAITGSDDHTARTWDLTSGHPLGKPLTGHTGPVTAVACSVINGKPVAITGSEDHTARTWDLTSGHPLGKPLTGHTGPLRGVACTMSDGSPAAVTTSDDETVRVWDLISERPHRAPFTGHSDWVRAVACTVVNGSPIAVTGSDDHTVRTWDLTSRHPHGGPLIGHTLPIRAVACTTLAGRPIAVTGSDDETVRVWDLASARPHGEALTGHYDWVRAVACTVVNGSPVAVTGSDDHTVRIWDLASGRPLGKPLTGHSDWVRAVACTVVDGKSVAVTGSEDETVRVWDLTSGRPHSAPFTDHALPVRAVACTTLAGKPVAVTGSNDYTVRTWDLLSASEFGAPLTGHTGPVRAIACTTLNGKPVAVTGSDDETVRVWDLTSGQPHHAPLTGHTGTVLAVACTVSDRRPIVATGSTDRTVRVWDLGTGSCVDRIPLPAPCRALAVTDGGDLVAAFGVDIALLARTSRRSSARAVRRAGGTAGARRDP